MTVISAPFRIARFVSLFLSFAFGIVALAMNISAGIKGNEQKRHLQSLLPPKTTVTVDTSDVLSAARAVAALSITLGLFSLLSIVALCLEARFRWLETRALPLQAALLVLVTTGLFGALVAMTDFVATRTAAVSATVLGHTLKPAIVQSVAEAIGVSPEYKKISYLRLAVIFPWIAFLFGFTSSVLTLLAALRARKDRTTAERNGSESPSDDVYEMKSRVGVGR